MKRALLPTAMLLSLWPLVFLAVGLVGAATRHQPASNSSSTTTAAPAPRQANYSGLTALTHRQHNLLSSANASSAAKGVPDPKLARDARALRDDDKYWITLNAGLDAGASTIAKTEANIADAVAALAAHPAQARLDAVNKAITAYDNAIRSR